jgi:hypothetical protein
LIDKKNDLEETIMLKLAGRKNFKTTKKGRVQSVNVRQVFHSFDGASKGEIKIAVYQNITRQKERLFESEQAICQIKQAIKTEKHLEGENRMNTLKYMMAARGFKAKKDKAQTTIDNLKKILKDIDACKEDVLDNDTVTRLELILVESSVSLSQQLVDQCNSSTEFSVGSDSSFDSGNTLTVKRLETVTQKMPLVNDDQKYAPPSRPSKDGLQQARDRARTNVMRAKAVSRSY